MAGIRNDKMHEKYSLNNEVKKKLEIYLTSYIIMDTEEIWHEIGHWSSICVAGS
jgi:hypothetical protein